MVGVQRSQGCRDCRRKKKGCDLLKPVCGQCARVGATCIFDERQWRFVKQKPERNSARKQNNVDSGSSRGDEEVSKRVDATLLSRRLERSQSHPVPRVTPATSDHSLRCTAAQSNCDAAFWGLYLPKNRGRPNGSTRLVAAGWVPALQGLANSSEMVRIGLNAVTLSSIAQHREDPNIRRQSLRLYGLALQQTNRALRNRTTALSEEVLASCKVLTLYEGTRLEETTSVSTQGGDWARHVEGACRIVELRGPEQHRTGHGRALFEDVRNTALIYALTVRSPAKVDFLMTEPWRTIPFDTASGADPRSLQDILMETFLDVPGLLEEHDELLATIEASSSGDYLLAEINAHIDHCVQIGQELCGWESLALATSSLTGNATTDLFTASIEHGCGFMSAVNYFWVASMMVYTLPWVLQRNLERKGLSHLVACRLSELGWMNPAPSAYNIAVRASNYMSKDAEAGLWGASCGTFPMGAALHYYAAVGVTVGSPEWAALQAALKSGPYGKVSASFMRSIAAYSSTDAPAPATSKLDAYAQMARKWFAVDDER